MSTPIKGKSGKKKLPRYVVITGATDGIGLHLLKRFAEGGCQVVGTGSRDKSQLPDIWPQTAHYCRADQRDPDFSQQIIACLDHLGWNRINLLVLNAAQARVIGPEAETDKNLIDTMNVNLLGPVLITHALAQRLEKADRAQVTIIGSSARYGLPMASAYAASKAGLAGFARALASEWQRSVPVQLIDPPAVATDLHTRAGTPAGWARWFFLDADYAAERIFKLILTRKHTANFGYTRQLLKRLFAGRKNKVPQS